VIVGFHQPVIPISIGEKMTFDISEEGEPCDFCGTPIEFFDDDWMVCPNCQAEYSNMDYIHGDIHEDLEEPS
jgi:hypothetical protein